MLTMSTDRQAPGWFYIDLNKQKLGPFSPEEFKSFANQEIIKSETLVWSSGYADWIPASEINGLISSEAAPLPVKSPVPEQEPVATGSAVEEGAVEEMKPRKGSYIFPRVMIGVVLSLVLAGIAAFGPQSR